MNTTTSLIGLTVLIFVVPSFWAIAGKICEHSHQLIKQVDSLKKHRSSIRIRPPPHKFEGFLYKTYLCCKQTGHKHWEPKTRYKAFGNP